MNKQHMEISNIESIIEMFDLRSKDRYRPKVMRRAYLYHCLKQCNYTSSYIGILFNKDHATVLHGLRVHQEMIYIKDKLYKMYMEELKALIEYSTEKMDLTVDIMNCKTLKELQLIQERIERNYYL